MDVWDSNGFMSAEEVVDDVILQLDDQAIDRVRHHPSSTDMHFGLGLWIRNEYIHSGKMGPVFMADNVSSEITKAIAKKALPEYANFPLAVSLFSGLRGVYVSAHRYFIDRDMAKMVDAISAHYDALSAAETEFEAVRKEIDWSSDEHEEVWKAAGHKCEAARDMFIKRVAEDLFDRELVENIIKRGDADIRFRIDNLLELKSYSTSDENAIHSFFVPAEISYLAVPSLKGTVEWETGKDALLWLLNEISFYPEKIPLPSWLFDDEEIALEALLTNGNLICFMENRQRDVGAVKVALASAWPSYKFIDEEVLSDREVLKAAFCCERCGNLLFEDFFRRYNDDDELVELALASSGENLTWASERIRDDFDMVCLAIQNVNYMDNIYKDISERLRHDSRIVSKIASSPSVPIDFPPIEFRDDDKIGALLANPDVRGNHRPLINMSKRIKELYMTEAELERWGDVDVEEGI